MKVNILFYENTVKNKKQNDTKKNNYTRRN